MSTRVWFITGCSTGFGRVLAEAIIARGERLIATARNTETIADLVQRAPDQVLPVALDVTVPAQVQAAVAAAIAAYGKIDVLVNNAGYGMMGAVEEVRLNEVRDQFETNVFGALAVTQAVLPQMRKQRSGHVLNISSVSGMVGRSGTGIYSASKFALEGWSESLAQEVAPLGIRVTIVEPGGFRTDFAGRSLRITDHIIDDYAATTGFARTALPQYHGRQPGDPTRAAQAMIHVVDAEQPPLRLALGVDAVSRIREKLTAVAHDIDTWEATSLATAVDPT